MTTPNDATATPLSRDAQIVAYVLFGMGAVTSVTYQRPHIITPRAMMALHELESAGMIEPIDPNHLPPDAKGWKATDKIGDPWTDYAEPTAQESFPLTSE